MSQPTIEAYGYDLPLINKPSNLQEMLDSFGPDKVYEMADKYNTYHRIANTPRFAVLDAIERVTEVKPLMRSVETKDSDGKVIGTSEVQDEQDGQYAKRATKEGIASKFGGDEAAFNAAMTLALKDVVIDYTKEPERRSGGPKKLGVLVLKRAQGVVDRGQAAVEKTLASLRAYLPEGTHPTGLNGDPNSVNSVAQWLVAFDRHEESEKAKREAALAA